MSQAVVACAAVDQLAALVHQVLCDRDALDPVQQAFIEADAFQCGYCTPGQIMSLRGLLNHNPSPTKDEIAVAVSGNLCRCGAYLNIVEAGERAAALARTRVSEGARS